MDFEIPTIEEGESEAYTIISNKIQEGEMGLLFLDKDRGSQYKLKN